MRRELRIYVWPEGALECFCKTPTTDVLYRRYIVKDWATFFAATGTQSLDEYTVTVRAFTTNGLTLATEVK